MTKEHVISRSVLRAAFGNPVRNVITFPVINQGKPLIDQEMTVRTVCHRCNSDLSPVDDAGLELLKTLNGFYDPTGRTVPFSAMQLRWLLKTHLNFFQVMRDSETAQTYDLHSSLKEAIVKGADIPLDTFRLMTDAWMGTPDFWNAESPDKVQFFSYRSIRFRRQRIVLSNLRMRSLDTMLYVPSDGSLDNLDARISSAVTEIARDFGHILRRFTEADLRRGRLPLEPVIPLDRVMSWRFLLAEERTVGLPEQKD